MRMLFCLVLLGLIFLPAQAQAGPVIAAFQVAFAAFSAGAGFGSAIAAGFGVLSSSFVGKLIIGATLSLVGQLFQEKPKGIRDGGIQTEQTTVGDVTPQKFVVGKYGLEGHAVAPAYSRGNNNKILTYILEFSNIPVVGLTDRIIINGQYTDMGEPDGDGTRELLGLQNNGNARGWIRIYDGTQTTADAGLVAAYSAHPDRPWTTNHVLRGSAYAVLEFERDQEVFPGLPSVRFEVLGAPLYDPREDTTVGGSGPQRWADPTTWEWSENPQVIKYNIFRGITLETGDVYGGGSDAEDLPLDNWFAAMNECDVLIGDRTQFVAGFEINTNTMPPADVIEEMDRACFGQTSEFGGVWRTRTGAPGAPVLTLTDDDFMIHEPSTTTLFPGLNDTFNSASGSYVDPVSVWESRESDAVINAEWEADDGDRRLPMNINLPAVSDISQAQHLLESYLKDSRRFRAHDMTLHPGYALLEPLDTLTFNSEKNQYDAKIFEVISVEDRPLDLSQRVRVREREASDVAWTSAQDLPQPVARNQLTPPVALVPTIALTAIEVLDSDGVARRNALRLSWSGDLPEDAKQLQFQLRVLPSLATVRRGTVATQDGAFEINEVTNATTYEVRARYIIDAPRAWSDWVSALTGNLLLAPRDLETEFVERVDTAFDRHDAVLGDAGAPVSVQNLFTRIEQVLSPIGEGDIPETAHVPRLAGDLRGERSRLKSSIQLSADAVARDLILRNSVRNEISAEVTTLQATKVDASGAVAAVNQEVSASYGDLTALASATSFAEATVNGISSGFVWSLGGDDVLSLVQVSDGVTEPVSTARIRADFIRLDGDTEVTGDFRVGGENLFAQTITANEIIANGISRFAVAGSGAVTNNSATWTTIATDTFAAPVGFKAQGIVSFLLSDPAADYPSDVLFRALIQGAVVLNVTKAELLNAGARRVVLPVTLNSGSASASVEIKLEMQNAGGMGVTSSNYSVTAHLR